MSPAVILPPSDTRPITTAGRTSSLKLQAAVTSWISASDFLFFFFERGATDTNSQLQHAVKNNNIASNMIRWPRSPSSRGQFSIMVSTGNVNQPSQSSSEQEEPRRCFTVDVQLTAVVTAAGGKEGSDSCQSNSGLGRRIASWELALPESLFVNQIS